MSCHDVIYSLVLCLGKPFDASKIINAAVANIIVSMLLGKRFDYKDSRFVRLLHLTNESMRLAGKPLVTVMIHMFMLLLHWMPQENSNTGSQVLLSNRKI